MGYIIGTAASERLDGTDQAGWIDLKDGEDTCVAGPGDDTVYGGTGNDVIYGGAGDDLIYGGDGNDYIEGGTGDDYVYGQAGQDTLIGGIGNNALEGGSGNDYYVVKDQNTYIYDSDGIDRGLIYTNFYKPSSSVENWEWAPGVQQLPYWIDTLLPDNATQFEELLGSAKTIYYCFPTVAPVYFRSSDLNGFSSFNEQQKSFVKQALAYISSVIDVNFVETDEPRALNTIAFANNIQENSSGYSYYPSGGFLGSDILLNYSDNYIIYGRPASNSLNPYEGEYSALVIIHELGHALGLKHPFSHPDRLGNIGVGPYLPEAEDSSQWTVMSYTSNPSEYYLRYSPLDIAALQYLYGPNPSQNTGDDRYYISSDRANFIRDGGGTDTIDASALSSPVTLYLEPGYWGYVGTKAGLISSPGQITVNFGTSIENAVGGSGNDILIGTSGDNIFDGGLGNDTLIGGDGVDTIAMHGIVSQYQFSQNGNNAVISSREGIDTFNGIEFIRFGSSAYTTDIPVSDATTGDPVHLAKQIADLYVSYFDRAPSAKEFDYWFQEIFTDTKSLGSIAEEFAWSNEYQSAYPSSLTNKQFVEHIYQNLFNREPDQGGWDYWSDRINTGSVVRSGFILDVIEGTYAPTSGQEDRSLIDNKHDASLYYTGQLALHSQEGYDIAIVDLLNKVNGDTGTVAAAERVIDYVFDQPVALASVMTNQILFDSLWENT